MTHVVKAKPESASGREAVAFTFRSLADIPAVAPETSIQGLGLGPGSVAGIVGPPNVSKTSFALDMGMHGSAGKSFFSLKVRRGPVAYFAPEAPVSVATRALANFKAKFPDSRIPFYLVSGIPALGDDRSSDDDTDRIIATLSEIASTEGEPVRLAFLDTVSSCMAGGEENGSGMQLLTNCIKRVAQEANTCVIVLHHPPKGDGKGLRGHGSLAGALDTIIEISADDASGIRTATLTKSRDTSTGLQLHYKLEVIQLGISDEWGDPVTTVIVRPTEAAVGASAVKATGANQQRALTAIREWARTHVEAISISSSDIKDLMKTHRIQHNRRPEVLNFLVRARVLNPSLGGYTLCREMLS